MSRVYLDDRDCTDGWLPTVCMVCGMPATQDKRIKFSWRPVWVDVFIVCGIPVWIILSIVLTKTTKVECPVCDIHRTYWKLKERRIFGFIALFFLGTIGLTVAAANLENKTLQTAAIIGILVNIAVSISGIVVVNFRGIRPTKIDSAGITLGAVRQLLLHF
jgi:hypothetical protein